MAKVLVVTSGKGGVGKTTSTAALGAALAQMGEKVVVVDFDVGLRNLDLVMGAERRVVFDLINVVQGVAKLSQALIRDKRLETLFLLPASQTPVQLASAVSPLPAGQSGLPLLPPIMPPPMSAGSGWRKRKQQKYEDISIGAELKGTVMPRPPSAG